MVGHETVPKTRINRKRQRRRQIFSILMLFLLAVAVGVGSFLFVTGLNPMKNITTSSLETPAVSGPINILLLGVDAGDGNTRTDTMIVASIDPKTKTVNMISVPRDTMVYFKGNEPAKINAAHAIGGPNLAMENTEKLLGISIPYYLKVNFTGFEKVVDMLGGVEVNVPKRLHYTDRAGGTYIDLQPGLQKLDGQQALNFARFRHDALGDLGRVKRQQAFLEALTKQLFKPENIIKWPILIKEASNYLDTNMSLSELTNLAAVAKELKGVPVNMSTLPGEGQYIGGISYFLPDQVGLEQLVKTKIFREKIEGNETVAAEAVNSSPNDIRVEVLNGTGIGGIANRLADNLREKGFQVVSVGNADSFNYNQTQIVDRTGGQSSLVQQIRNLVGNSNLQYANKSSGNSDLTIIIGKNFVQ